MGKLSRFLFAAILCLIGCGKNSDPGEPSAKAPIGHIQIDAYISQEHRDAMAASLAYLDSIQNWQEDPQVDDLMGLNDVSSQSLHQWLEDRVQYIVDQSFDVNARAYLAQSNYSYENPWEMPAPTDSRHGVADTGVQTLGLNIGTEVYLYGKQNQQLIGVHISRVGDVPVSSPRTGIIQVGDGAFFKDPNNTAAKIFVMSVMFHEARHGDGHGKTAGFTHAICPKGHIYADYAACDNNTNGPYTVQAEFIRTLAKTCANCNASQNEFFSTMEADSLSRVVPTRTSQGIILPAGHWDDRPEGHR